MSTDRTPANPTIGEALCADGIHEADGPCCSAGYAGRAVGVATVSPVVRAVDGDAPTQTIRRDWSWPA